MLENVPVGACIDNRYWRLVPALDPGWLYDSASLPNPYDQTGKLMYTPGWGTWGPQSIPPRTLQSYKWQAPPKQILTTALHAGNAQHKRGTDPEFFLAGNDGQRVPAFHVLPAKSDGCAPWFWDGFQAETTVKPASCHEFLVVNISTQMAALEELGHKIHASTVWRVPDALLDTSSDAQVALGCDPSENAYGLKGRQVLYPKLLKWRFAGGHMHFQMEPHERENLREVLYIVKTLDAILGVPSVALFQNTDHWIRRRYYGLAGEFRRPEHGLEYRTLSNAWAWHPLSTMLTFDLGRWAFSLGRAHFRHLFKGDQRQVVEIINSCDVRAAKRMVSENRELYNLFLDWRYAHRETFWRSIDLGIDKVIPNFGKDIVGVWQGYTSHGRAPHWSKLR